MVGLKLKIIEPLQDVEASENYPITLGVLLSKPAKPKSVSWSKDGQVVVNSDRCKIEVSDDGLRHTLTMQECTTDDQGDFFIEIKTGKRGPVTSCCKVAVIGEPKNVLLQV